MQRTREAIPIAVNGALVGKKVFMAKRKRRHQPVKAEAQAHTLVNPTEKNVQRLVSNI